MLSGRDKKISSVGASDGASLVSGADTPRPDWYPV